MELATQIQQLSANLPKLPASRVEFACSLIRQFNRKGTLTINQTPHVTLLLALATGQAPVRADVGDFSGVIALFKQAGAKLKFPKIRLQVDGVAVVLSLAGERSSAPGSVNVAGEGSFGDRAWYGRVSPDGKFDPSRQMTPAFAAQLVPVLTELSSTPVAAVQRYGRLTGHCMFCAAPLTDPRSKAAGFGETCAHNWGLHQDWKTASTTAPVPVTAVL